MGGITLTKIEEAEENTFTEFKKKQKRKLCFQEEGIEEESIIASDAKVIGANVALTKTLPTKNNDDVTTEGATQIDGPVEVKRTPGLTIKL